MLLYRRLGITRIENGMLVFNRREALLEHLRRSSRKANRQSGLELERQYPDSDFGKELAELLRQRHVSEFPFQRKGEATAKKCVLHCDGESMVSTDQFILSNQAEELARIAIEIERFRLNPFREQNAFYLLEHLLCRETFEKLPMQRKWFCHRNVQGENTAAEQ